MASKGKKISELTALTSASLQTTLVGVDNGTTYKVTLDVLEDAIISMVSRSTDLRLDSLEEYTASVGAEIDLTPLNSFTSSQSTLNSVFTTGINARLQTSSFNEFSASVHSEILAATNEQDLSGYVTQLVLNTLSGSVDGRIDSLEENSSSYETKGSGILSGSVSYESLTDIPAGIVSQSVDIADFVFTTDTITNSDVTIVATDGDIVLNADGNVYVGSSNAGNGIVTNQYFDSVIGDINRINNGTGYSITDNLDNVINSIPSISSLNTFTSSQEVLNDTFATTGSNVFNGNQTIDGSLTIVTPSAGVPNGVSNWNGQGGWNQGFYSNLFTSGGTGTGLTVDVAAGGGGYITIDTITINTPGSGYTNGDVITIDNENNLPGVFTIGVEQGSGWVFNTSGSLTTPGDVNVSGSIYADNLDGLISSSTQILDLGFVTGSYTTINEFNTLTQSFNSISQSFTTISSSVGGVDFNGVISGSSQLTSSFDERYTLSGSVTQTTWDNINGKPDGIVSQSTDLTSLNSYTQSLQNAIELTGSTVSFLGNIVVYGTQSVINSQNVEISDNILYLSPTASTDNDLGVVGHYNDGTYRHAGIFMDASDGHSWKVFNGLQTETTATVDTAGTGFTLADFKAGAITGTSFSGQINSTNGVISGSSQLTSSFDTRYAASGSVGSSVNTSSLATTGSNSFNGNQTITGSLIVSAVAVVNGGVTIPTGSTITLTSGSSISVDASGAITGSLTGSVFGIGDVVAFSSSVNSRLNSAGGVAGTISSSAQITTFGFVSGSYETTGRSIVSGSSQLTSSYDSRYTLSGSVSAVPSGTISGSSQINGIVNLTNLSATSQISASVFVGGFGVAEAKYTVISAKPMTFYPNPSIESVRFTTAGAVLIGGNHSENNFKLSVTGSARIIGLTNITGSLVVTDGVTGSIAATNGVISGSSQLTSSYDTRYALSGSGGTIPGGTISGSTQITTLGFATTSSLNTLTASFNSFTASAQSVTTGSNSFNGTQTITGSLIITTGSFVASQILANTASLYLTSGSNLYVQNNGVVEITGSLNVSGSAAFNVNVLSVNGRSGDEGGEINLAIPVTNTTLQNRVSVDVWRDRLRLFEGSADAKGVYIDLSKAPAGVGGELTWKASGLVDAGTFLTLDNVKVSVTTTSNRGLSIGAVSTSFVANIGGNYATSIPQAGGASANTQTYTTTASASAFGWNFGSAGDISTYILNDTTNSRVYRITLMIGTSYNNNFITIERLH